MLVEIIRILELYINILRMIFEFRISVLIIVLWTSMF